MGDEYKWCCVEKVFYWHHYLVVSWSLHREVHLPLGAWGTSREHWIIRLCVRSQYMIAHHPPVIATTIIIIIIIISISIPFILINIVVTFITINIFMTLDHQIHCHCYHWLSVEQTQYVARELQEVLVDQRKKERIIMMTMRNGVYNSKDGIVRLSNHRFLPE